MGIAVDDAAQVAGQHLDLKVGYQAERGLFLQEGM